MYRRIAAVRPDRGELIIRSRSRVPSFQLLRGIRTDGRLVKAESNWKPGTENRRPERSIRRRHREAGGPIVLARRFATFRDRPGLAAGGATDIDNRAAERVGLCRHRVAARAGKKTSGFSRVDWPFIHADSTMPQPSQLHNSLSGRAPVSGSPFRDDDYESVSAGSSSMFAHVFTSRTPSVGQEDL